MNLNKIKLKKNGIICVNVFLFMLIIICFKPILGFSKTYFVSIKEGSDHFVGSLNKPFKTIKLGVEKLNEGDTLIIKEGIYYLNQEIKLKSNISISTYKNEKVEIHGTELKNDWIQLSNNLWKCTQKDSVIQLFINGLPYFQAAYPNISENINALKKGVFAVAYPTKEMFINGLEKFKNLTSASVIGLH